MPIRNRPITNAVPSRADSRMREIPALRDFHVKAGEVFRDAGPGREAFAACEAPFCDLVESSFLTELVNHELSLLVEDPAVVADGLRSETAFDVAQTADWTLSVRIMAPRATADDLIWSSAEHLLLGIPAVRGARELEFIRYEQPAPEPCEVLDPDRILMRRGRTTTGPGQVRLLQAGKDVLQSAAGTAAALILVLTSAPVMPFRWGYDVGSLRPVKIAASGGASWRLDYAMRLLAAARDKESVPVLNKLAGHEHHFVRWTAIRAVTALDPAAGTALIKEAAAGDPHPHIRQAAGQALAMFAESRAVVKNHAAEEENRDLHD
jgi:hypothetical protein